MKENNLTYQYLWRTGRIKRENQNIQCLHPENHNNNDTKPSMKYYSNSDKCYCFTCNSPYDIRDFIKADYNLTSAEEIDKKIKSLLDKDYKGIETTTPDTNLIEVEEDLNFNSEIDKQLKDTYLTNQLAYSYFMDRGISEKVIKDYKLTAVIYFNDLMINYPNLSKANRASFTGYHIIPFINEANIIDYYLGIPFIEKKDHKGYMKYKAIAEVSKKIFNDRYIKNNEDIIFITEGVLDSLSIESVGNYKAISLLGTATSELERLLKDSNSTYILMLDNDPVGIKAEENISNILDKLNIEYISHKPYIQTINLTNIKDSNDMLKENKAEFTKLIELLHREAKNIMKNKKEDVNTYLDTFLERVKRETYKPIPTHLKELDKELGGGFLKQSIITLGGATSTGKTTLLIQMLYNMLKDNKVIYYSLEMSQDQVISKLISHVGYKNDIELTSNQVLQGYLWTKEEESKINTAINKLKETADNLIVKIPDKPNIDSIINHALKVKAESDSAPFIVIDYLQLIQGADKEDIQSTIKDITRKLKRYVIDNDTLAFLITAYNRDSTRNNGKVKIESGRDTSDIEYSSDYMLGLNFTDFEIGYKDTDIDTLKKQPVRDMTLKILKNRLGNTGVSVELDFKPRFNTFIERGK